MKNKNNTEEIVSFGILGCGRIGSRHAERICLNKRAKLKYIYDYKISLAKEFAIKYGGEVVEDFDEFLKKDFDVVSICTPSGLHAEQSIKALENNKNVLCEKPMALNLIDADRIIEAEKKSKGRFFLVKQNRFNEPIVFLKEAVVKKQLGDLTFLNSNILWNRRKSYFDEAAWRGTMSLDGGALFTQCSHFIDLMVWLGGDVEDVYCKMVNLDHDYIETEDAGLITISFKNNVIGSLQYTTNVYKQNYEGTMTVLGKKGTVKIGGQYLNKMEYWDVEDVTIDLIKNNSSGRYDPNKSNHDQVIQNVIDVLKEDLEIATNSMQGRQSIEVMQAAYLSSIKKKQIKLPLTGEDYKFKLNEAKPISGHKRVV